MGLFLSWSLPFSQVWRPLCVNGLLRLAKHVTFSGLKEIFHNFLTSYLRSLMSLCMQVKKHSSYLMTIEMSLVGSFCLLASTYKSPDGEAIRKHGFFYAWTPLTLVMNLIVLFFSKRKFRWCTWVLIYGVLLNCSLPWSPTFALVKIINFNYLWRTKEILVRFLYYFSLPHRYINVFQIFCWSFIFHSISSILLLV